MKKLNTLASLFMLLLVAAGCQPSQSVEEPSAAEKKIAEKEISARIEEIVVGCKNLDMEAALKPYSDSPEFRIVTPDGRITDYPAMKVEQTEFAKQAKAFTFTTIKEDFKFLSKTLVMCTYTGKNEFTLKTGEHYTTEPYIGSMLFKKTNDEWKIIYAHESSAQPKLN